MKPSEILAEIEQLEKQPRRIRIYVVLGFCASAAVAVGGAYLLSWVSEAGKRRGESTAHAESPPLAAPVAVVQPVPASPPAPQPLRPKDRTYTVDTDGSPSRGPQGAPLTVVEFMDFEGPHCKEADETLARLEAAFPGKVRRVYKAFPLGVHAHSRLAARAALAADALGKFWPMHDGLFRGQDRLDEAGIEAIANGVGIKREDFLTALARVDDARVERDERQGRALRLAGVPTVFINGRMIYGASALEVYKKIAIELLAQQ